MDIDNRHELKDITEDIRETLYPVSFVLHYVGMKRDELVQMETDTIRNLIGLKSSADSLGQFIASHFQQIEMDCGENKASDEHEDIKYLGKSIGEFSEKISQILQDMSRKDMVFEDMNNMLRQTGFLTSELIFRDNLTLAYNRYFYFAKASEMYEAAAKKNGLSLAFIDIDYFRDFNTKYGHDFGDIVLRKVTEEIQDTINSCNDTYLIRVGGDEFLILSGGTLIYKDFVILMEKVLRNVANMTVSSENLTSNVTISIGTANSAESHSDSLLTLYRIADENMYLAKGRGRNTMVSA